MRDEKDKICTIEDTEQLRSVLSKGGKVTCSKCCASSDDPATLCSPVMSPGANLFCD